MIADLKQLWQEAFEDKSETINAFFTAGFGENRYNCIFQNGKPVSALYWFDCYMADKKLAYIYAVATARAYQGKGLARNLMEQTHTLLCRQNYAGAILVPGNEQLFSFYEKLGYRTATAVGEFSCTPADTPVPVTQIDADRYARLRKTYLPPNGVLQEGPTLAYLHTYGQFYAGKDFLLTASVQDNTLVAHELLGNIQAAPGILNALGLPRGSFRSPGTGRNFAMFLPLQADCPAPSYFGLALD